MSFKIVKHEWELTKEEREIAKFLIKEAKVLAADKLLLVSREADCRAGAYKVFKDHFFEGVTIRLGINKSRPVLQEDSFGALCTSDDGKKMYGYRVERVQSKHK